MHHGRIGMATGAKLNDPSAILVPVTLRPLLYESVTHVGGWIAAVTSGTGESAAKMNVVYNLFQIHVL
jgi:hypothetical protein